MNINSDARSGRREHLPSRRRSIVRTIAWRAPDGSVTHYDIGIGFYADGRPGEVFVSGGKVGSAMRTLLEDACVLVSIGLRLGAAPADLSHSLGRLPVDDDTSRLASVIGAVVEALVKEASNVSR